MAGDEFEPTREALIAWYVRGDRAAGGRFARGWLLPQAEQMVSGLRALGDERRDCVQYIVERFLDRLKADGAAARGFAFWRQRIRWYIKDYLRARGRLPMPASDDRRMDGPAGPQPRRSADDRMIEEIAARRRAQELRPRLANLGPAQRAYFLVYFHRVLGELLTAEDVEWIASQTAVDKATVRARLAALPADPAPDVLLALLFDPARLEHDRVKCLDAFRKGRKRAVLRLLAGLQEGAS